MAKGLIKKIDEFFFDKEIPGYKSTLVDKILKTFMVGTLGLTVLMAGSLIAYAPYHIYNQEQQRTEQKYQGPKQVAPIVEKEWENPMSDPTNPNSPSNLLLNPIWRDMPGNVYYQPN